MKIKKFLFVITTMFLMVQGASAWSGSGSSGDPYLIASTADWETFATSTDEYSDTFFKLTADITVTTMRTKTFKGTFDGGGHTLTFNYTATGDNAAPFAYITGATIKNLRVAGTINTGYKFAAGIVAISNGGSIENCQSSVTIEADWWQTVTQVRSTSATVFSTASCWEQLPQVVVVLWVGTSKVLSILLTLSLLRRKLQFKEAPSSPAMVQQVLPTAIISPTGLLPIRAPMPTA